MSNAIIEKTKPKYARLKALLLEEIKNNYSVNERFPSTRTLVKSNRMSLSTVSRALSELANEGVLERRIGGGTFIKSLHPSKNDQVVELPVVMRAKNLLSVNWFINYEIQRGISNSYNGPVRFCSLAELESRLEYWQAAILFNPDEKLLYRTREIPRRVIISLTDGKFYQSNCVLRNMMHGIYEMMSYLIAELGHRRIGLISSQGYSHYSRVTGYRIALRAYGLHEDPELEQILSMKDCAAGDAGYSAMERLLELKNPPTAIFADTDMKAVNAIQAARDRGLDVPGDISVVGFDDIPGMDKEGLTTIKSPLYELGAAAVAMLKELELKKETETVILPTRLVIRKSCAYPRKGIKTI